MKVIDASHGPVRFWSRDYEPWEEDAGSHPLHRLTEAVLAWRLDADRAALSIVNRIRGDSVQGMFINLYRLLELLLTRTAEDELERMRFDKSVSREAFMTQIKILELDLASGLRERVRRLSRRPEDAMRKLWALLVPDRKYAGDEVFSQIAKLRNLNVHRPTDDEVLRLPWEEPPFDLMMESLASLLADVITIFEEDVAATSGL